MATTILVATTAMVVGLTEIEANLTARTTLREALAGTAGLSVTGVDADPFGGRLMLRGIEAGRGATRVTIGRLTLPVPSRGLSLISPALASPFDDAPADSAPAKPDSVKPETAKPETSPAPPAGPGMASAENVTITTGQTTIRIKRIDMAGTTLTAADIKALVDPNSAEPAEARLKKLTASAIVVPEIVVDDATPGSERHATIRQVLLSGAVAGKIAAGSAAGVDLSSKIDDASSTGSIGAIQASAVDLVQIARVFSTVRSDDAEPIRPLYESVTVTGLKVTDTKKKSTVSLGTLKATGAKARPLATDFVLASKSRTTKPTDAEQAAAFADMTNSFEIGTLEADDFGVQDEQGAGVFSLGSVAMHDFAKGRVGGFALRTVRFDGPDVKFGIGTVEVGAFALPKPQGVPLGDQDPKTLIPALAKLDIGDVDADITSRDKATDTATRISFKLRHIGGVSDGVGGDIPKSSKFTIDNLTFDLPPNAAQARPLIDMGYRRLDVSAVLATSYDAADQELKVDDLSLNGVDMGSLGLGLHLVNVSKGIVSQNQEIAKASALAILIKGLRLDLVNMGLVDRALAWKAKADGISTEDERAFVVDFLQTKLPASMNGNANLQRIGTAAAKFVAAPKNLHIDITSKSGLGAGSMALLSDPGLLLDTLDVKASAND